MYTGVNEKSNHLFHPQKFSRKDQVTFKANALESLTLTWAAPPLFDVFLVLSTCAYMGKACTVPWLVFSTGLLEWGSIEVLAYAASSPPFWPLPFLWEIIIIILCSISFAVALHFQSSQKNIWVIFFLWIIKYSTQSVNNLAALTILVTPRTLTSCCFT